MMILTAKRLLVIYKRYNDHSKISLHNAQNTDQLSFKTIHQNEEGGGSSCEGTSGTETHDTPLFANVFHYLLSIQPRIIISLRE